MTRLGARIEPITSPTLGECANDYATDAGFIGMYIPPIVTKKEKHSILYE